MPSFLFDSSFYILIVLIGSVIIAAATLININRACYDIREYIRWVMYECEDIEPKRVWE